MEFGFDHPLLPSAPSHVSRHHGLLGTVLELRLTTLSVVAAERAERIVVGEIERLQRVFSQYDDESELHRWQRGETEPGPELTEVLRLALGWQDRSAGAFNPAVGRVFDLWSAAADADELPEEGGLAAAAEAIASPAYRITDRRVLATGAVRDLNLNAIAKGWIVDRAAALAIGQHSVVGVTLNAGGDLLHRGPDPLAVGIEDPYRPYDNVRAFTQVTVTDGAVATSGGSRRGWLIAGRRHSHVIDPRSGRSANHVGSASVLAHDATTADVVATILTVLPPDEGLAFADGLDGVGCCIVDAERAVHRNGVWSSHETR